MWWRRFRMTPRRADPLDGGFPASGGHILVDSDGAGDASEGCGRAGTYAIANGTLLASLGDVRIRSRASCLLTTGSLLATRDGVTAHHVHELRTASSASNDIEGRHSGITRQSFLSGISRSCTPRRYDGADGDQCDGGAPSVSFARVFGAADQPDHGRRNDHTPTRTMSFWTTWIFLRNTP